MSKFYFFAVAFSLITLAAPAQSLTPQVVTSAGGYFAGGNGSLDFTIGEMAVGSFISGTGSLTQGFQPPLGLSDPLPLDFLSLTAKLAGKETQLEWITIHEINTDYFIVERSSDGLTFHPIATIAALSPRNTATDNTYQVTDSLPLPGVNYYRIKEVDRDGQATYSPIASVKISTGLSCMVYPNPATDVVYISIYSNGAAHATIAVYDLAGRLIVSKAIDLAPGQNQFDLNVTDKPKGMYFIKIIGLDGLPTYAIMKK